MDFSQFYLPTNKVTACFPLCQVLHTWLLPHLPDYTVKDLIEDVRDWVEEGYVDSAVWKRLQNCVVKDVLPTFSERTELRQRSLSSESLATDKHSSDSSHQLLDSPGPAPSTATSSQSPQATAGISIGKSLC